MAGSRGSSKSWAFRFNIQGRKIEAKGTKDETKKMRLAKKLGRIQVNGKIWTLAKIII